MKNIEVGVMCACVWMINQSINENLTVGQAQGLGALGRAGWHCPVPS